MVLQFITRNKLHLNIKTRKSIPNIASNKRVGRTFKFRPSLLFFSIEFLKVSSSGICITKTYFHLCITPFPLCVWVYSEMFVRALILILTCWSVFLTLFHIQILNFSNIIYPISWSLVESTKNFYNINEFHFSPYSRYRELYKFVWKHIKRFKS